MKKEVAEHLKRADEFVVAAEVLLANDMPAIALGRAYYAMFHAATAAVLARENVGHRVNGRNVLIGDHTKTPKDGRRIP